MTKRSVKKMSPRTEKQFAQIREDRKESILSAALHLFAEQGYHSTSISKIAKEANISKGLLYNYFEGKEEVLKFLLSSLFEKIVESMQLDINATLTKEVFIKHIDNTFILIENDRPLWRLYFSMITQKEVTEIAKAELLPKVTPFIMEMLNYFESKGHKNPMVVFRYFSSTMDGAKMQWLYDPENYPLEDIKQLIIKQFIL